MDQQEMLLIGTAVNKSVAKFLQDKGLMQDAKAAQLATEVTQYVLRGLQNAGYEIHSAGTRRRRWWRLLGDR